MRFSVIIPAHNEEAVIHRCLTNILNNALEDELEVIVVCNGCTDNTTSLARSFGLPVKVLVTGEASKTKALNLGDQQAACFPRFYVDADVLINIESLREMTNILQIDNAVYAVSPQAYFEMSDSSWLVKAYYTVWQYSSFFQGTNGIGGSGVYALSETGRKAFGDFPEIILDDAFINRIFKENNKMRVKSCFSTVNAPLNLWDLIKIKSRGYIGLHQLKNQYPLLFKAGKENRNRYGFLKKVLNNPGEWHKVTAFSAIVIVMRLYSQYRLFFSNKAYVWERDNSSRNI